ncbi:YwiC-like family protein [Bifidobacterium sp. ESL0769]|uniref:YwiC-like family protein n=1 Tax=Bifidobacterium sp. ESL0769 TaxID=2983229 RepID=UPI0023FA2557|nr:YwiC-like family protein [Bifidobacterium sp. ESL0769]WEV67640.1 YwiC-like family protein [Bifidobacterium sp. ESL0769]
MQRHQAETGKPNKAKTSNSTTSGASEDNLDHTASRKTTETGRHSDAYIAPVTTYFIATAIVGIPVFVFAPRLIWWLPAYLVLATLSFLSAWLHQERSLWGNAVAVIAAGTMSLLAVSLGSRFFTPIIATDSFTSKLSLRSVAPANTTEYYLASPLLPKTGVVAAFAFILSEYATVLFVKTMIRKHGHIGYYALSASYHVMLIALAFATPLLLQDVGGLALPRGAIASALLWGIPAVILLMRATIFPLRHKRMQPMHIGIIEAVTSLMNIIVIIIVLA